MIAQTGRNGYGIMSIITVTKMLEYIVQLTFYDFQSRTKNGHGIMSVMTIIKMLQHITYNPIIARVA